MVFAINPIWRKHKTLRYRICEIYRCVTSYGKNVRPSSNSAVCDNLLHCNFFPSFGNFIILADENKKYLLEIKESLLIMRQTLTK